MRTHVPEIYIKYTLFLILEPNTASLCSSNLFSNLTPPYTFAMHFFSTVAIEVTLCNSVYMGKGDNVTITDVCCSYY